MLDPNLKLSPHFTLHEFTRSNTAARRGIDNTPTTQAVQNMRLLCQMVLEPVRLHFGPVSISSGYRGPALNKAAGGAKTSQHMSGEAADFEVQGVPNVDICRWIARNCPFDQIILEFYSPGQPNSGWVHVSYRDEKRNRKSVMTAQRINGRTIYMPGFVA